MAGSIGRFSLRTIEQGALWATGCALVVLAHSAIGIMTGVILLAVVYARSLEFVHECLHATALPRASYNMLAGELLAAPMLVSFSRWRREHMQHHRDVRIEGFRYEYARLDNVLEYVVHSLMLRHVAESLGAIARLDPRYRTVTFFVLAVIVTAMASRSWLPVLLWLMPFPFAAIVHTHIELPEHFGLAYGGDPLRNSRVIPANRFVTWFVNGNNYHAIHHWKPSLRIDRLRAAYISLPTGSVATSTYRAFYRDFYALLLRRDATGVSSRRSPSRARLPD
jgi:fatty acid desaturase